MLDCGPGGGSGGGRRLRGLAGRGRRVIRQSARSWTGGRAVGKDREQGMPGGVGGDGGGGVSGEVGDP